MRAPFFPPASAPMPAPAAVDPPITAAVFFHERWGRRSTYDVRATRARPVHSTRAAARPLTVVRLITGRKPLLHVTTVPFVTVISWAADATELRGNIAALSSIAHIFLAMPGNRSRTIPANG